MLRLNSYKNNSLSRSKRTRAISVLAALALVATVNTACSSDEAESPATEKSSSHSKKTPRKTTDPTPTKTATRPPITVGLDDGIPLGTGLVAGTENEGATRVDIYFDYACGYCELLGSEYGTELSEAADAGTITLVYHPVIIHTQNIFANAGAGAEFFVAEKQPDKYFAFHELLHKKAMGPYLNGETGEPTVQDIVAIAREAGVSEENCNQLSQELTQMEDVLLNGSPADATPLLTKILDNTERFIEEGGTGTPTVLIDGKKSRNWVDDLSDLLDQ